MPFTDMVPTDQNDPERKFVMYKAAANQGGSDSNDGLTQSTPLATTNEWWQRITGMNNNRCWPWLYELPGDHTDSLDACNPVPGAPGLNLQSPTSGMGSFPVISGAWPGHPLYSQGYAAMRDSCVQKGGAGKVPFSSIYESNYTTVWLTFDCPGKTCLFSNASGRISGGNHRIKRCQYVWMSQGNARVIGDGGLTFAAAGTGDIGGIWCVSEGGRCEMLDVPITFEGACPFYGATAYVTNQSYLRCGVTWVNKQYVTGGKFVCQDGSGINSYGKVAPNIDPVVALANFNAWMPGTGNGAPTNYSYVK